MVRLGIEAALESNESILSESRLGLITNPTGVDSELRATIDLLYEREAFDLRRLFGPEHGIRGSAQAGVAVEDRVDETTGLPVTSLYGEERRLRPEMLRDIDTVVYDVQDVGCRFYTVIYTLAYALEGVAEAGKRLVVLDRPNPIAPLEPSGNRVPDTHASFVGNYELPIVHGMTVGELATYVNGAFDVGADLRVVEMDGWDRTMWYDDTDLPWVYPSPNIPSLGTAVVYPGTCFFEGTNLSEGRGTTKPFELIGAPWIDGESWADTLDAAGLPGVAFRPVTFTPTFSKHEAETVEGVQVHIRNRDDADPVRTGLTMLVSAFAAYDDCDWVTADGGYFIDKLAGGTFLRETVDDVATTSEVSDVVDDAVERWDGEREAFIDVRERHLRY